TALGVVAVAGDDAGDVGAVTVVVIRICNSTYKIDKANRPLRVAVEVVVVRRNPRIDRRDADAGAGKAQLLPDFRRSDRRARSLEGADRGAIDGDAQDLRVGSEHRQQLVRDLDHMALDGRQVSLHLSAMEIDHREHRGEGALAGGRDDDARTALELGRAAVKHSVELVERIGNSRDGHRTRWAERAGKEQDDQRTNFHRASGRLPHSARAQEDRRASNRRARSVYAAIDRRQALVEADAFRKSSSVWCAVPLRPTATRLRSEP